MATQLITSKFSVNNLNDFIASFNDANNTFYAFLGKTSEFPSNDDVTSSSLVDSIDENVRTYKSMLVGKMISNTDIVPLAIRHDWATGTVYLPYSNALDLFDTAFYVCVNEANTYYVYKCLDNANGAVSTQQPTFSDTAANDIFYQLSDGYQWKYLYTINNQNFQDFATSNYIPVIPDANVSANAVAGAIDVIHVVDGGLHYNNYISGVFASTDIKIGGDEQLYSIAASASSVNNFYSNCMLVITDGTGKGQYRKIVDYEVIGMSKLIAINSALTVVPDATSHYEITPIVEIIGDGQQTTNAEARAIINVNAANSVSGVEILNRGAGYFYATASVLHSSVVPVGEAATLSPIMGPCGGHGANVQKELDGKYLGVLVSFANTENGTIPAANDFRQIGLIKNPKFASINLTTASGNGTFVVGETFVQSNTGARGKIAGVSTDALVLTGVTGNLSDGHVVVGQSSNAHSNVQTITINGVVKGVGTFDATYRYIGQKISGSYTADERVNVDTATLANTTLQHVNGVFYCASSNATHTTVQITEQYGTFSPNNAIIGANSGMALVISTVRNPDITFGSGEVLYLENFGKIDRSNTTTQTFKLSLEF